MGVQQNTMWQQPPPQQSSTNPFAAPSGPSVRDYSRFFSSPISFDLSSGNFYLEFFVPHAYLFSIFFLSLFSYLCASVMHAYSNINFFFSLTRRLSTNESDMVYLHSPTFSSFFFRLTTPASNDTPISNILVGEKKNNINGNCRVGRLSCFHYSLCLSCAHVLYK
jgi:hypothetical protein